MKMDLKNVVSLDLVSEEFLRNEMGESRCRTRENGLISDSVEKIFKDRLKSEKTIRYRTVSKQI